MRRICIATCATKSYIYALPALLRSIARNVYSLQKIANAGDYEFMLLLVGDSAMKEAAEELLPLHFDDRITVRYFIHEWAETKNYQKDCQLTIGQMRTKMHEGALQWGADFCWSLDADVLPPENALTCSLQMLMFDSGYYSVAACPYPSQGGGAFLTGRGDQRNPIFADFDFAEREVSPEMQEKWDQICQAIEDDPENEAHHLARFELRKEIERECPPKHGGNIWKLNAEHGWRRRGWFDFAYPALGRGAVVPVDWCGFGCTLMDAKALAAADFTGYDGGGTEDLFIIWHRWFPKRLRICSIPHCPCDHIVRTGASKKLVHTAAYHEEQGSTEGHLRKRFRPWHQHHLGEVHDPANDGVPSREEATEEA
jgi:hypothetical protein